MKAVPHFGPVTWFRVANISLTEQAGPPPPTLTRSLLVPSLRSWSSGRRSAESLCTNCVACLRRLCWCSIAEPLRSFSLFGESLFCVSLPSPCIVQVQGNKQIPI
ncbi:hypothetical protein XENTR_v10020300 [Xenopus tropicalis]|nr:hypothetical protein XENTR_v10020300 [Xenopus tropicalis]